MQNSIMGTLDIEGMPIQVLPSIQYVFSTIDIFILNACYWTGFGFFHRDLGQVLVELQNIVVANSEMQR